MTTSRWTRRRGLSGTACVGVLSSIVVGAAAVSWASPALADVDADFTNELQAQGIYAPRDYSAWLGKIVCERLRAHVDGDASTAAAFSMRNLPRGTNQQQAYVFLEAAIQSYCPEQLFVLVDPSGAAPPAREQHPATES